MLSNFASIQVWKNMSKFSIMSMTNLLHTNQVQLKEKIEKKKEKKSPSPQNVAVILVGCGALDGSEISEAVSVAIHLSKNNLIPKFFAPNIHICELTNHLTKAPEDVQRNALVEAARLARGDISPLCQCNVCEHVAVIVPGGWGAAKTLSDFASKGCNCVLHPELESLIYEFWCRKKPIGSICIASALIAKILLGTKVTLGKECPAEQWPFAKAIGKVKDMGAKIEMLDVKGVAHCKENNVYSTPAWLDTRASYADIHEGIGNMITMMKKDIK